MQIALLAAAAVALFLYLRSKQPGKSDVAPDVASPSPGASKQGSGGASGGAQRKGPPKMTLAPIPKMTVAEKAATSPVTRTGAKPVPSEMSALAPMSGPVSPDDQLFGFYVLPATKPPQESFVLEELEIKVTPEPPPSPLNGLGV